MYVRGHGLVRRPQYIRIRKYSVVACAPGQEAVYFNIAAYGSVGEAFMAARDYIYDEEGELRFVRKLRSKELETKGTKVGVPGVIWTDYVDPLGKKSYKRFSVEHPVYTGLVYSWYIPRNEKNFDKAYDKAKREAIAKRKILEAYYNSAPRVVNSTE